MLYRHQLKQTSNKPSIANIVCRERQYDFSPRMLENGLPEPLFQRWNA